MRPPFLYALRCRATCWGQAMRTRGSFLMNHRNHLSKKVSTNKFSNNSSHTISFQSYLRQRSIMVKILSTLTKTIRTHIRLCDVPIRLNYLFFCNVNHTSSCRCLGDDVFEKRGKRMNCMVRPWPYLELISRIKLSYLMRGILWLHTEKELFKV